MSDDGLPTPRAQGSRPRAVGQETPPLLQPRPGAAAAPKNVPGLGVNPRGLQMRPESPEALSVSYRVWRGPTGVTFEPGFAEVNAGTAVTTVTFSVPGVTFEPGFAEVNSGTAVTTVTFSVPGTYVLRARATDGRINISAAGNPSGDARSTETDVTVVVRGNTEAAMGRRSR